MRWLDSGSVLLNLALSGAPFGGWPLGRVSNIIGDRSSGKTALGIEAAALALRQPPQGLKIKVCYMEVESSFDAQYAERIGLPVEDVEWLAGDTVEDLETHLAACVDSIDPILAEHGTLGGLFIVDSLDALSSRAELARSSSDQTYGTEKQRILGKLFRQHVRSLEAKNIHLMIISQIRDTISSLPFAPKHRRGGGRALDFYCSQIIWLAESAKIRTSDKLVYGIEVTAKVNKNKVARPYRNVAFPILFEYGIDNTTSLIRWVVESPIAKELGLLRGKAGYYDASGLLGKESKPMRLGELVSEIESVPLLFRALVQASERAWSHRESSIDMDRVDRHELLAAAKVVEQSEKFSRVR